MGAFLCSMSDSLCFGDARDNKFRDQWEQENGTYQRPNEQIPLVGSGRRYTKKGYTRDGNHYDKSDNILQSSYGKYF